MAVLLPMKTADASLPKTKDALRPQNERKETSSKQHASSIVINGQSNIQG